MASPIAVFGPLEDYRDWSFIRAHGLLLMALEPRLLVATRRLFVNFLQFCNSRYSVSVRVIKSQRKFTLFEFLIPIIRWHSSFSARYWSCPRVNSYSQLLIDNAGNDNLRRWSSSRKDVNSDRRKSRSDRVLRKKESKLQQFVHRVSRRYWNSIFKRKSISSCNYYSLSLC